MTEKVLEEFILSEYEVVRYCNKWPERSRTFRYVTFLTLGRLEVRLT